jgi:ribonuclease HI
MTHCVWALGDEEILEHVISKRSDDARLWLFWLFDTMNQHDLARILITMWAIWWARRRAIHDDEFQSPLLMMCFVNRYLQDLEIATTRVSNGHTQSVHPRVRRWIPPGEEAAKINVDGAISRQGTMGASAAICRDGNGNYIGASTVVFEGLVDAPSLEAQACNEALALAQDLLVTHAIIASDCLQVVSDVNGAAQFSSYALVLNEIRERATDFVRVIFRFENREVNYEAHALAKAASSLPVGRHLWLGTHQTLHVFLLS